MFRWYTKADFRVIWNVMFVRRVDRRTWNTVLINDIDIVIGRILLYINVHFWLKNKVEYNICSTIVRSAAAGLQSENYFLGFRWENTWQRIWLVGTGIMTKFRWFSRTRGCAKRGCFGQLIIATGTTCIKHLAVAAFNLYDRDMH